MKLKKEVLDKSKIYRNCNGMKMKRKKELCKVSSTSGNRKNSNAVNILKKEEKIDLVLSIGSTVSPPAIVHNIIAEDVNNNANDVISVNTSEKRKKTIAGLSEQWDSDTFTVEKTSMLQHTLDTDASILDTVVRMENENLPESTMNLPTRVSYPVNHTENLTDQPNTFSVKVEPYDTLGYPCWQRHGSSGTALAPDSIAQGAGNGGAAAGYADNFGYPFYVGEESFLAAESNYLQYFNHNENISSDPNLNCETDYMAQFWGDGTYDQCFQYNYNADINERYSDGGPALNFTPSADLSDQNVQELCYTPTIEDSIPSSPYHPASSIRAYQHQYEMREGEEAQTSSPYYFPPQPDGGGSSDGAQQSGGSSSTRVKQERQCGVCGDRALGYNFNAVTCESCKAFFRRNALKNKILKCPFQNNCKVDTVTRRFCQKCRLQKCFDIGMKKEWIMTEEEKQKKKQKIEANKIRKLCDPNSRLIGNPFDSPCPDSSTPFSSNLAAEHESLFVPSVSSPTNSDLPSSPYLPVSPDLDNNSETDHASPCSEQEEDYLKTPPPSLSTVPSYPSDKPQAVVIGMVRSNEDHRDYLQGAKVTRLNNQKDVHSSSYYSDAEHQMDQNIGPGVSTVPREKHAGVPVDEASPSQHGNPGSSRSFFLHQEPSHPDYPVNTNSYFESSSNVSHLEKVGINLVQNSAPPPEVSNSSKFPSTSSYEVRNDPSFTNNSAAIAQSSFSKQSAGLSKEPENIYPKLMNPAYHKTVNQYSGTEFSYPVHSTQERDVRPTVATRKIEKNSDQPCQNSIFDVVEPIKREHEFDADSPSNASGSKKMDEWSEFNVMEALRVINPGCADGTHHTGSSNVMDDIVNSAVSAEYSPFTLLSSLSSGASSPGDAEQAARKRSTALTPPEQFKLNELKRAHEALDAPLNQDLEYKVDHHNPSLINVINMTDIAIRRLIQMCKQLSAFSQLCTEDQIALLKGSCTEMMILKSVTAYDPDKDSWNIPEDHDKYKSIKLKVLKGAPGNSYVYDEHKKFIFAFQPAWRHDQNIMLLLSAITLFTPSRANVKHPEAIKYEQCVYLLLLKRYLECQMGACEGRTVYSALLERVTDLRRLNENHLQLYMQVNPELVRPLLIEIFDLKNR